MMSEPIIEMRYIVPENTVHANKKLQYRTMRQIDETTISVSAWCSVPIETVTYEEWRDA
jgi:hypothetical protein